MMDQLPYCANIKVEATSCNLGIPNTDIIGGDFITSLNTPVSITYKYTKWNGDLVEIDTNLDYTLDTKNKTFTLSNNTIFGTDEKPYIRLCCNDVKVPIVFIDSDGTGNKWYNTKIESDSIILEEYESNIKVKISKFCTVNWNKTTEQNIFLEKNTSSAYAEYYACEAIFGYLDGPILKSDRVRLLSTQGTPINKKFTIPRLDGIESTLSGENGNFTKKFSSYLMLGVQIKISDGYSVYQNNVKYYIEGTNNIFDNTGILKTIKNKRYLLTENYFPKIFIKTNTKWNSKFFFTTQKDSSNKSYYISPSTSIIKIEYEISSYCPLNCNCNDLCGCDDHATVPPCSTELTCIEYYDCKNYSYFKDTYKNYNCYSFCECYDVEYVSIGWYCNNNCECYGYEEGLEKYDCYNYAECAYNEIEDYGALCDCNSVFSYKDSEGNCRFYLSCSGFEYNCSRYNYACPTYIEECTCDEEICNTDGICTTDGSCDTNCPTDAGEDTISFKSVTGGTEMYPIETEWNVVWEQRGICRIQPGTYTIVDYWGDVPIFSTDNSSTGYAKVP